MTSISTVFPTVLPDAALRVMRIGWMVVAGVLFLVAAGGDLALRFGTEAPPPGPPLVVAVAVGLVPLAFGWWWARKAFESWRIEVDDERIRVDHGVVIHQSAFVPRTRIQHVSTQQGPLQRSFDLTSLTMHTAGARTPNIEIPHLHTDVAEQLRHELVGDG